MDQVVSDPSWRYDWVKLREKRYPHVIWGDINLRPIDFDIEGDYVMLRFPVRQQSCWMFETAEGLESFKRQLPPPNFLEDVRLFHEKFDQAYDGNMPTHAEGMFRIDFLEEEVAEYKAAFRRNDHAGMIDALGDIIFVAVGTAYKYGWDINEAWRRIVRANMQKVIAPEGKWKIAKPEGWTPPDHSDLVK